MLRSFQGVHPILDSYTVANILLPSTSSSSLAGSSNLSRGSPDYTSAQHHIHLTLSLKVSSLQGLRIVIMPPPKGLSMDESHRASAIAQIAFYVPLVPITLYVGIRAWKYGPRLAWYPAMVFACGMFFLDRPGAEPLPCRPWLLTLILCCCSCSSPDWWRPRPRHQERPDKQRLVDSRHCPPQRWSRSACHALSRSHTHRVSMFRSSIIGVLS